MENSEILGKGQEKSHEVIPSLQRSIDANQVVGFDLNLVDQNSQFMDLKATEVENSKEVLEQQRTHSVSISMPPSPIEAHLNNTKKVGFRDDVEVIAKSTEANNNANKFHSQPMPLNWSPNGPTQIGLNSSPNRPTKNPRIDKLKDERYKSFKTRNLSNLRGKTPGEPQTNTPWSLQGETLPVDRYFDALEGPELDTLRPSEEIILPEDKQWPFLLRYQISSFGICLGVGSQVIMWKNLASTASTHFLHISLKVNLILWCISILLFAIVATTYLLKVIFYFEAVRREYYHPIRVNFFFAPWIALLFLAIGVPSTVAENLHQSLWYILMTPIFCLELKIYGQWMSGGQRRLSKVANPSNHLSVVGNFVGALLGASMGLKEGPIFFFAVGLVHYTVLFVTLYQRLPTNETVPKELHPVFFLFVAAPSVASMAWAKINGSFDYGSRVAYFIALFLYFSLAVRVNFFRGFKFSLAWWAYTFPMTGAATATIKYSSEVSNTVTKVLSVILSVIAVVTVTGLLITTIIHAFVLKDLFPNDIAIAISDRKPNRTHKWYHGRSGSSEKDIEHYLKFVNSEEGNVDGSVDKSTKDIESQSSMPSK